MTSYKASKPVVQGYFFPCLDLFACPSGWLLCATQGYVLRFGQRSRSGEVGEVEMI